MLSRTAFNTNTMSACCQGAGTADDTLVRVIISRCEVDMVQIKQEFQRQFGTTLDAMIEVSAPRYISQITFNSFLSCKKR